MPGVTELVRIEALLDENDLKKRIAAIEAALRIGVRPRQLPVRSLLLGMALSLDAGRPVHLTRVHEALVSLPLAET